MDVRNFTVCWRCGIIERVDEIVYLLPLLVAGAHYASLVGGMPVGTSIATCPKGVWQGGLSAEGMEDESLDCQICYRKFAIVKLALSSSRGMKFADVKTENTRGYRVGITLF